MKTIMLTKRPPFYGIRFWDSPEIHIKYRWHLPRYRYNQVRELDFGKFSIFFGGMPRIWMNGKMIVLK